MMTASGRGTLKQMPKAFVIQYPDADGDENACEHRFWNERGIFAHAQQNCQQHHGMCMTPEMRFLPPERMLTNGTHGGASTRYAAKQTRQYCYRCLVQ